MNTNNRRRTRTGNQRSRFSRTRQSENRLSRRSLRSSFKRNTQRSASTRGKLNERRRIRVFNLNKEFQNTELKKLFEPYGTLIRCGIHFNKMGESKGTADIEFSTHEECESAISKLDNAEIDGVKVRVKYADFGPRTTRRTNALSQRRRNAREINRENKRNKTINRRGNRKVGEKNGRKTGSSLSTRRRRAFRRVLGRRRK